MRVPKRFILCILVQNVPDKDKTVFIFCGKQQPLKQGRERVLVVYVMEKVAGKILLQTEIFMV